MRRSAPIALVHFLLVPLLLAPGVAPAAGPVSVGWMAPVHSASVQGVAVSPDGATIATGGSAADPTVKILDAETGAELDALGGHADGVRSVDFSPDGSLLAVGFLEAQYTTTGNVRIWDLDSGTELRTIAGAGCRADFSPDGTLIASGGGGVLTHLDVHRVSDGVRLHHFQHGSWVSDAAFSPDGVVVASAGSDNTVKLWDSGTGAALRTLSGHTDDVNAVAFSPDGSLIATGAGGWDSPGEATVRIWRVSDGALLRTLSGHEDWVDDVEFSADGATLVSSGRDGAWPEFVYNIRVWNVADGALLAEFDAETNNGVPALRLPQNGEIVYGRGDGTVVSGALASPPVSAGLTPVRSLHGLARPNPFRASTHIAFAAPAEGRPSEVRLYDVSGALVRRLPSELRGDEAVAVWDGRGESGRALPAGVYWARPAEARGARAVRVVLVR
ncbi:MAG TPA: hypothetical protein VKU85_18410 [bacterium]|nr:hypothetical protein [bacterium]